MKLINLQGLIAATIAAGSTLAMASTATANTLVKVTIENLSPSDGLVITPLWVGFHDGMFDTFDLGSPTTPSLKRLAEDGNTGPITTDFLNSGDGVVTGTITGAGLGPGTPPVIPPSTTAMSVFTLDENLPSSQYFSYAAMVVPSNDAFIGNENPLAFKIFDDFGNFMGADFIVTGTGVWDAGTEENDEIPENTPLLGQTVPDTGVDENGVVTPHPGFIPNGNILTAFPGADFTTPTSPNYQIARIRIQKVPESSNINGLLAIGGFLVGGRLLQKVKSRLS